MSPNTVIKQSSRTASRVVEGSAVVIVIDQQKLHTLNEVGTFVWNEAGPDGRSVDDIIGAVVEEFEVERDVASKDVLGFVEQLIGLGALEVEAPG